MNKLYRVNAIHHHHIPIYDQDPFVKVLIEKIELEKQTKAVENGGISPTWLKEHEATFEFEGEFGDLVSTPLVLASSTRACAVNPCLAFQNNAASGGGGQKRPRRTRK